MADKISSFRGENYFLSNFYETSFIYKGLVYRNAEAAFQAQKCVSDEEKAIFTTAAASDAKHWGRRVKLRPDWESVKVDIMREVVRAKFKDGELRQKLLATGDAYLEEGNDWGDRFWGVCNGNGANNLGKILMEIRDESRTEN